MKNSKTENKLIIFSMGITTLVMVIALLSVLIIPVASNNDTFQANVTVGNAVPVVSSVTLNDSDGGTIQLAIGSNANYVNCTGLITDQNGYLDVSGANATFFLNGTASDAADDKNNHYTNTSCTLFGGTGTTVWANCSVYLEHEAINGSWSCNITAIDLANTTATALGNNTVDQLVALDVWNATINWGSMTNGQNTTSAQALGTNVSNEGNVVIDVDIISLSSEMICTGSPGCLGVIGVGNITANLTRGSYDTMKSGINLTTTNQTFTGFDLGLEGVATADDLNATRYIYWGIQIPASVKGEFNTNITISALIG